MKKTSNDASRLTSFVAVVMMQRNESELLPTWLAHYEYLFGSNSIWILDDASTDPKVAQILKASEHRGVTVVRFEERQGVDAKGALVQEIASRELTDFLFVLPCDADELLYLNIAGSPTTDRHEISNYLRALPSSGDGVYRISHQIRNVPQSKSGYIDAAQKGFLGRLSTVDIDLGFHFRSPEIPLVETDLGFIHLTNRPYAEMLRFARQKLEGRITSFAPLDLSRKSSAADGNHLPALFFKSESLYYKEKPIGGVDLGSLLAHTSQPVPWSEEHPDGSDLREVLDPVNAFALRKKFAGSSEEFDFMREAVKESDYYMEYGAGGSTLLALHSGPRRIVSCETDIVFIKDLVEEHELHTYIDVGRIRFEHLNVGPTVEWGYPVAQPTSKELSRYFAPIEENPQVDFLLIDGRYRVATAAMAYLHLSESVRVLVHDYWPRAHYHELENLFTVIGREGSFALFEKRNGLEREAGELFLAYRSDPR